MKAIFAGTFDPPTLGHWDVVVGAAPLFEKLYIVIATNTTKTPLLDVDTRVKILKDLVKNSAFEKKCEVITFDGLVVDLCKKYKVEYLVRGVRSASDLERELPMSLANETLSRGIKTILIPSTKEHSFVSSTLVREITRLGGDVSKFVPEQVTKHLSKGKKK
jgi:pantetheine-phosphate adenylyltransferase